MMTHPDLARESQSQVVTDLLIRRIALVDRLRRIFGEPTGPVERVEHRAAQLRPDTPVIVC